MQSSDVLPTCSICCDVLGRNGGVVTLPCGHNGCHDCLKDVQSRNPHCPLCRAPFDASQQLSYNHELRDLVVLATSIYMDDSTREEGWEAFPTAKLMSEHYASELAHKAKSLATAPSAPPSHAMHSTHHASAQQLRPEALNAVLLTGAGTSGSSGSNGQDLLQLEPPQWLPDSFAANCGACALPFKALLRLRHHCRCCGKIYCNACCAKRLLLPPKYQERAPQRVCEMCAALLEPLQPFLIGRLSRSVQPPVHDAIDSISLRSWINTPWSGSLEDEIYKAANIVNTYAEATRLEPERALPTAMLAGARGLALLSVLKVGAGWSATVGSGLVLARQADGTWSAPCAAACYGLGWGLQLGGELTDLLLVLRNEEAVSAFCGNVHLGVAGNIGAAMGPVGRQAEASLQLGDAGRATAYAYSCSKGAFIGVSVDGTLMRIRDDVNLAFYGYKATARQILLEGAVPQPPAASSLYNSLDKLMDKYENRRFLVHSSSAPAAIGSKGATAAAVKVAGAGSKRSSGASEAGGASSSSRGVVAAMAAFAGVGGGVQQQPRQQQQQQHQQGRQEQQEGWSGSTAHIAGAQELPAVPTHPVQHQQQPEWRWRDDSEEEGEQLPSLFD